MVARLTKGRGKSCCQSRMPLPHSVPLCVSRGKERSFSPMVGTLPGLSVVAANSQLILLGRGEGRRQWAPPKKAALYHPLP